MDATWYYNLEYLEMLHKKIIGYIFLEFADFNRSLYTPNTHISPIAKSYSKAGNL